jgi:uncharacterized protein YkwD
MSASIRVRGWAHLAAICGVAVALVATMAPSAGATAQHHARHHRRHHHRRHHHRRRSTEAAVIARGVIGGCAYADIPATTGSLSEMRAAVVCLVNQQRAIHSLPSLLVSSKLNTSAQNWNQWMVSTGNFTHGSHFAGRISAVGYDWQTAGENIATGFGTPRQVVNAWMASPDHCRNILDPSFRQIGTGVTSAVVGSWATQPSTWTNDFGLLMSQNPASGNTAAQNGCPY